MKFCQLHWDKLRAAIAARGIDHLVAKSGEAVIEGMKADLAGEERPYDPLMDCHWMITTRALEGGGLYLMGVKEDGTDYCPVCEAESHGAPADSWIEGPADAAFAHCRRLGLLSRA